MTSLTQLAHNVHVQFRLFVCYYVIAVNIFTLEVITLSHFSIRNLNHFNIYLISLVYDISHATFLHLEMIIKS